MAGHQYRYIAKQRLAKAIALLATNDEDDLVYACLELRKCIEAISYEQLTGYLAEVPLKALEVWQPDKVIKEMQRIDPAADQTIHIRMLPESENKSSNPAEPDGDWIDLGEDRRLKAGDAAKAYHQLGNFLHVPTIRQTKQGVSADTTALRKRATEIKDMLSHVLSTTVWNTIFSVSVTVSCSECDAPVKRRSEALENGADVECGNCGQLYEVKNNGDGTYSFTPRSFSWECVGCKTRRMITQRKLKSGMDVTCPACKLPARIAHYTVWEVEFADGDINSEADAKG